MLEALLEFVKTEINFLIEMSLHSETSAMISCRKAVFFTIGSGQTTDQFATSSSWSKNLSF